jgi:hypothetical protein
MLLFGKGDGEGGRIGEDSGEDLRSIGGAFFLMSFHSHLPFMNPIHFLCTDPIRLLRTDPIHCIMPLHRRRHC